MGKPKVHRLRHHAAMRAAERYDIKIGPAQAKEITRKIRGHRAVKIERSDRSFPGDTWDVTLSGGRMVRVVYNSRDDKIVTFLPIDHG